MPIPTGRQASSDTRRRAQRRRWFRLLAIAVGLTPLVLCELALRIADVGRPSDRNDPYIGFVGIQPLFVLDRAGGRWYVPESRISYFRPESFAADKAPHEFRIFCLGGSTVQGRPYAIETSFTTWLELSLTAAAPGRKWEVVNCGGVSYASYRLAPIMDEILHYEPDLVVLYTGHNEFLEDRTYASIRQQPAWIGHGHAALARLRTYNVARSAWLAWTGPAARGETARLPTEVDARLDYRGGLERYHRDDAWKRSIVEHFEFNLRRMIQMADRAGVPVVLVNPVSNLQDSPPFKSEPRADLSESDRDRIERLRREAELESTPLDKRIELVEQAVGLDPRHAARQYQLGKLYEAAGRYEEARDAFIRAKDEDVCPLRCLEAMHHVIDTVARDTSVTLVDARALFTALSPHGLVGEAWMVDHVHPTITGHQKIAAALVEELERRKVVVPADHWTQTRKRLYEEHLRSLDPLYFEHARRRLDGLRRWTQGRAFLEQ